MPSAADACSRTQSVAPTAPPRTRRRADRPAPAIWFERPSTARRKRRGSGRRRHPRCARSSSAVRAARGASRHSRSAAADPRRARDEQQSSRMDATQIPDATSAPNCGNSRRIAFRRRTALSQAAMDGASPVTSPPAPARAPVSEPSAGAGTQRRGADLQRARQHPDSGRAAHACAGRLRMGGAVRRR